MLEMRRGENLVPPPPLCSTLRPADWQHDQAGTDKKVSPEMISHQFDGCNIAAAPPPGFEEMIQTLYCFHNGRSCVSAWKPTRDELAELNAGGSIYVSVMSGITEDGKPAILPLFVGTEEITLQVTRDTGRGWK